MIRTTSILFFWHIRRLLVSRRALICFGIGLLPIGAAVFVRYVAQYKTTGPPPAVQLEWVLVVQLVVPIASLILGSAVIAEEVEDRTITYLITRPVPRPSLLLGRYLASVLLLSILLTGSAVATVAILGTGTEPAVPTGLASALGQSALLGGIVYCGLFAAMGAIVRHPVLVGLAYTFAVEGFLSHLPGKNQALTIQYYLRSYFCAQDGTILERMQHAGLTTDVLSAEEAVCRLLWIVGLALVVGCVVVSRRQYVLSA